MTTPPPAKKRSGAKMDRKFNRTARDIDRALAAARLAPLKTFLVERAREACWAVATMLKVPPVPFRLDLKALAHGLGVRVDTLAEVHNWLVAANVFRPAPSAPGLFLIEKDYRAWVDPATGAPLITAALADDAERSARLTVDDVRGWAQLAIPERRRRAEAPEKSGNPAPEISGDPSDSRKNPVILRKNPESPIEERARDQSLTESLRNRVGATSTLRAEDAGSPPTIPLPTEAERSPNLPSREDLRIRDAALAQCDRLFPMLEDVRRAVQDRAGGHPIAWYPRALEAMSRQPRHKWTARYLGGILAGYARAGGPPVESGPASRPSGPAVPTSRRADGRPHDHDNPDTIGGVPIADIVASNKACRPMRADEMDAFRSAGRRAFRKIG